MPISSDETTPFAPVPVLTGEKIAATRKLRPKALRWITLTMIAFNVFSRFMPHTPSKLSAAAAVIIFVIFTPLEIWTYTYFWKGRNWARILMLIVCALQILTLTYIRKLPVPTQVFTVVELVFSAALFYWLMQKQVVAFFKAPGNATSKAAEATEDASGPPLLGL